MLKGNTRRRSEIGSGNSSEISQEAPAMKSFQVKLKLQFAALPKRNLPEVIFWKSSEISRSVTF